MSSSSSTPRTPPTPRLISRAQGGSLPCFAEIVRRYEGRLFNFLLRRTRSIPDAEDLVQETFVRAWQRIGQYNPRWQFSTWLFTIANRLAIERRRRMQREASFVLLDRAASAGCEPAGPVADREQCRHIWALADRILSETQRTALWLRYGEELGPKEIARVLGQSQVGVRVTLCRARKALAAHLGSAGEPEPAVKTRQHLTGELAC
jgi:RNA polymerase sigma-70 factor (ECF subfamily)